MTDQIDVIDVVAPTQGRGPTTPVDLQPSQAKFGSLSGGLR